MESIGDSIRRQTMRYVVKTRNNGLDWTKEVDRMMDQVWGGAFNAPVSRKPAVDFLETEEGYKLVADIPGVSQEDLSLEVKENLLTFSTPKKEEKDQEKADQYLLQERRSGEYARSFRLPKDVDQENISAELKNGVLTVVIGKKPEASPRKITIN